MKLRTLFVLVALLMAPIGVMAQTPEAGHQQATIAGTALELLPDIDNGLVEVIAHGEVDRAGNMPIVIRNNSDEPAMGITIKVDIRDKGGALVGVAETLVMLDVMPYSLEPGDVALASVNVQGQMPAETSYAFNVAASDPDDIVAGVMSRSIVDVTFGSVDWLTDRIVGEVRNPSDRLLNAITLTAICFDEDGRPTTVTNESVMGRVEPESSTTFQLSGIFNSLTECERFLVAGFGFADAG